MKKNSFENLLYSVAGVVIVLVILIVFNALTATFRGRIDLTKQKLYTLSPGTRALLSKIKSDDPIKIRFYYSRSEGGSPETVPLKTYAQHVEDLLAEYKQAARGGIILEQFDPKPDSDAEDSARLDGVEGGMLRSGEKFFLGIAVSRIDTKEALPFLDPGRETLLEYDLSRAISRVVNPQKPVVGVMSPLPIFGQPMNPMMARMGQQGQQPWVFISELKNDFTVRQVEMTADKIDADIKVLLVVHPKSITDQAQFAIDQFVMRGGKLVAFLDSTSLVDSRNEGMMGQMPGAGSTMDKLLKAWGLEFDTARVAADENYMVTMGGGRNGQEQKAPAFLDLTGDAINKNEAVSSEISHIWYPFGGAFTGTPAAGLKETVFLKTSKNSQMVEGVLATMSGESILKDFKASDKELALAIRLDGKFKTAFPDGKPKDAGADKKDETKPADKDAGDFLKETKSDNSVVLVGDADMLADQFSLRQRQTIFGPMGYEPANGNLALAQNIVDQFAGDSDLIGIRSRAAVNMPFTRIKEMEAKARKTFESTMQQFEKTLEDAQLKINQLQSKKDQSQKFILSKEQQTELENLRKQEAEANKQLKAERKRLSRDINSLENNLKWGNIIGMPALVALSGVLLALYKRKRTSAK